MEDRVQQAQGPESTPEGCPPNRLFVPEDLISSVIQSAHASLLTCYLGALRTLLCARQCFWWLSMATDIREFVVACPTCARSKDSNGPQHGLLQPLPTCRQPWLHIALNFVTRLPPSEGHTMGLTVASMAISRRSSRPWNRRLEFHGAGPPVLSGLGQGVPDPPPDLGPCKRATHRRRTRVPRYQSVWLSTQGLPIHPDSRKLSPKFIWLFPVSRVVNPYA